MKKQLPVFFIATIFLLLGLCPFSFAQSGYKTPPKEITEMLLAKRPAAVSVDNKGEWMVLMHTNSYAEMEDLAAPELRIAGLRINPANFAPSRMNLIEQLYLREARTQKDFSIEGLPIPLHATGVTWSPDQRGFAFLQVNSTSVDLYQVTIATRKAIRINKSPLNIVLNRYQWIDASTLLYFTATRKPTEAPIKS